MKFMLNIEYSYTQIPEFVTKERDGYYVEIDSLEELLDFQNNLVGRPGSINRWEGVPGLIIWKDDPDANGLPTIEVYDGYRE